MGNETTDPPLLREDRNTILLESMKLRNFLETNHLVQANAIAQKLEGMVNDYLKKQPNPEENPYWGTYISLLRIKSEILSGRQIEALRESEEVIKNL